MPRVVGCVTFFVGLVTVCWHVRGWGGRPGPGEAGGAAVRFPCRHGRAAGAVPAGGRGRGCRGCGGGVLLGPSGGGAARFDVAVLRAGLAAVVPVLVGGGGLVGEGDA